MKHYSSWTEQQRGEFLDAYDDSEPRSEKRSAILKRFKIDPKNQGTIVAWLRKMDKGPVEEQTALALPDKSAPESNGVHANLKGQRPGDGTPQVRHTNELRRKLVAEYRTLPERSDERRAFLERNGLKDWQMSQWGAAYGVRDTVSPKLKARADAHSRVAGALGRPVAAKATVDPETGKRKFSQKSIDRRAVTRAMPAEAKLAHARAYAQLPARDGSRGRYCEEHGIALSAISYWAKQVSKGLMPGTGEPLPGRRAVQEADDVEELTEAAAPSKKSSKPSYADLMEQNLILKGLLKRAERMGFDVMKILSIGE